MATRGGSCSAPTSRTLLTIASSSRVSPVSLSGGKVQQLKPQIAERTAVCAAGNIVVLVVSTKAEATAFARFLADPPAQGGLGCWDALNLDGGPSTQLVVKLPALALLLPGGSGGAKRAGRCSGQAVADPGVTPLSAGALSLRGWE